MLLKLGYNIHYSEIALNTLFNAFLKRRKFYRLWVAGVRLIVYRSRRTYEKRSLPRDSESRTALVRVTRPKRLTLSTSRADELSF